MKSNKGWCNILVTEQQTIELLNAVRDPFLHKTLEETNGIVEVRINSEKAHVSVKIALAKIGTPEQLQLQTEVVDILKNAGAESVGLRFTELPEEELEKHRAAGSLHDSNSDNLLSPNSKTTFIAIASGKGGVGNYPRFPST